jgi:type IV pilus assembly protein PilZ
MIFGISDRKSAGLEAQPAGQGMLSLTIRDAEVLYATYMPFIRNGGLFIPTNRFYRLGDEIFMLLTLLDETDKLPVTGKVVWITPQRAQANRSAGIGVQFSASDDTVRAKIESLLAGHSQEQTTHTL